MADAVGLVADSDLILSEPVYILKADEVRRALRLINNREDKVDNEGKEELVKIFFLSLKRGYMKMLDIKMNPSF